MRWRFGYLVWPWQQWELCVVWTSGLCVWFALYVSLFRSHWCECGKNVKNLHNALCKSMRKIIFLLVSICNVSCTCSLYLSFAQTKLCKGNIKMSISIGIASSNGTQCTDFFSFVVQHQIPFENFYFSCSITLVLPVFSVYFRSVFIKLEII